MTAYQDNIVVLLLFYVVHLLLGAALLRRTGRRPWLWVFMESAAAETARRLNRGGRSDSERIVRGAAVFVLLTLSALAAGSLWALAAAGAWGWIAGLLLLSGSVSAMTPVGVMRGAGRALSDQKTARARDIAAPHLREEVPADDTHALARKTVEYGMESLCLQVAGPSLAFVFFGATGVFVYVAVMAQFLVFGRMTPAYLHFGATVRAAERLINILPAALTALLLALAAGVVSRGKPVMALVLPVKQARGDDSFNRGLVMAAAAGGLGISLGGPRRWPGGEASCGEWMGAGGDTARTDAADLKRAAMLGFVAFLILSLAFSGALMMRV